MTPAKAIRDQTCWLYGKSKLNTQPITLEYPTSEGINDINDNDPRLGCGADTDTWLVHEEPVQF